MGGTAGLERIQQLPEELPDSDGHNGASEMSSVRRRALEQVRGDFEEKTWRAFWRATIDGDAPADVAADLGVSVWTVYKARARVLSRLRDQLNGL
jgi:RNA polymerase sigma-70 factor (ECF subfamily)